MEFLAGWSLGVLVSVGCVLAIWCAVTMRRYVRNRTIRRPDVFAGAVSSAKPTGLEE
jgi:hypothetical protein